MKRSAALLTFAFLIGTSASALAAATPEEAQRLTTLFQAYLGKEPGVVTVTPNGDSYAARFDVKPLFAKIKEPGVSASLTPIEWSITDQGGGKWKVDQDQSLSFAFKVEGTVDMKGTIASVKGTGVFDEALGTFASTAADYTQIAFEQVMIESGQTSTVKYTVASVKSESTMTGTADAADGTSKYTYADFRETVGITGAADGSTSPMEFAIASPGGMQDATVKGLKPKALTDLAAWLVARPGKEAIVAEQAALKDKLRAVLPVFSNISGTSSMDALTVNTMLGKFSMDKLDVLIDANGVVENGAVREKFTFSGFKAPDGVIPPWAAGLVPANMTIDVSVADFNLAAPAAIMLDKLDLSKDPPLPPDMENELLQALLPKGVVTIGIGASEFVAKIFDLKAEGSMTAGPVAMPAGQALLRLKGIDDIMAAIQAAPPELGMGQVSPVVIVAKGMGKQDADGYMSWKIESTPTGSVTINGVDISKMGGQ
ncbi:hypothetical protein [Aestuariivirga sp.]|uniref:hypothetical protein n=1 Tax=Aestuariivirga sp. TaxID=2650926 RepID=UPI003592F949